MAFGRDINIKKANELLDILNKGTYIVGNRRVIIPEYKEATYYKHTELGKLTEVTEQTANVSDLNITIINKSTVDAVIYEASKSNSVGVLNFASAMNPGGGFIKGAMAQEEALCQASTLYIQLKDGQMYKDNKNTCWGKGYYNNSMNVCETYFIKDGKGSLLANPAKAIVVTSAAANLSRIENVNKQEIYDLMYNRMEEIIKMFIRYECKTVILGAFGCGVFKNDPNDIANIWKELLEIYGGHFNKVVFAIMSRHGDKNIEAFNNVFKS